MGDKGIVDFLIEGAELTAETMQGRKELETNALLALRAFVNLFDGDEGKVLMTNEYEKV